MIIWNIHLSNSDSFDAFSWQNGIFFIVHLFMSSLRDQGLCCLTYSNASSPSSRSPVTVKILSNQSVNMSKNKVFLNGSKLDDSFKTRAAEVGSLLARARMPKKFRQAHICYFRDKCIVFARTWKSNSVCNIYHAIMHFWPKNTGVVPKKHFFAPKSPKKCVNRNKS